jgi:hypothetical protein
MIAFVILELTLREVIGEIPHDLGALIAYSLLVAFIAFIAYGSRSPRPVHGDDTTASGSPEDPTG